MIVLGLAMLAFVGAAFLALHLARPFEWGFPGHAYCSWFLWSVAGAAGVLLLFGLRSSSY